MNTIPMRQQVHEICCWYQQKKGGEKRGGGKELYFSLSLSVSRTRAAVVVAIILECTTHHSERGTAVAAELLQSEFNHKQEETRAKTVWISSFTKTSTTNRELRQTNEDVQQQWITRQKRRGREGNRNRARRQKLLLLLSSKDYENCVKTHERRKSGTQKKTKKKIGNQQASTRDRNKTIATKAREMQKVRANEGGRARRERERSKTRATRERAREGRERGREKRKFGSGELTDGRTKQTNERTNERMSVLGRSFQPDFGHVWCKITAAHIVHLITYQNVDRTVKKISTKIWSFWSFLFLFSFN